MMISRWIDKSLIFVLLAVIAFDGFFAVRLKIDEAKATSSVYRSDERHETFSPPSGYTAKHTKVDIAKSARVGWVVRYVDVECTYCDKDTEWVALAPELQRLGYQILTVLPYAKSVYPDETLVPKGVPQAAYVNLEWIRHFRLTMTPTLLIFSSGGHLIWYHRGVMSSLDRESAVRAIDGK